MRFLLKLALKFVMMVATVALLGHALRYGGRQMMQSSGAPQIPGAHFSSEEADLMSTVFSSAVRMLSGSREPQ